MGKQKKKHDEDKTLTAIVLITAILNLVDALLDMIRRLTE